MNKEYELKPFHKSPLLGEIYFSWSINNQTLKVRYDCRQFKQLIWPLESLNKRTLNLWQSTCFEIFLKYPSETSYLEFNFSPSGEWDAFKFDSYRSPKDLKRLEDTSVIIVTHDHVLTAELQLPNDWKDKDFIGNATAVIKLDDQSIHYFSYKHSETKPDFHDQRTLIINFNQL